MIDKFGMIKEMLLEEYSNNEGKFSLEFSQTPFGDLGMIYKHGLSENGYERKSGYKSTYFEDSRGNDELFYINNDKAKEWFYEEMGMQ
jgi:hypothetical protein